MLHCEYPVSASSAKAAANTATRVRSVRPPGRADGLEVF